MEKNIMYFTSVSEAHMSGTFSLPFLIVLFSVPKPYNVFCKQHDTKMNGEKYYSHPTDAR